jgi:hypothetical protein
MQRFHAVEILFVRGVLNETHNFSERLDDVRTEAKRVLWFGVEPLQFFIGKPKFHDYMVSGKA